jgi:hypothetical protein
MAGMARTGFKTTIGAALALALAGASAATLARAQTGDPPPGPPAKPSADPKDFSGVWQQKGYAIRYPVVGGGPAPYLPWAAAEAKRRGDAQRAGQPITDSTAQCMPSGVPRVMGAPYPIEVLQTNKEVVILHEVQHLFRHIYLNEQHPADLDPTFMGHSVGHWEGDTLVVDTTALNKDTLINEAGDPHSDKMHIVERWSKSKDGTVLTDLLTIDDPGAYARPWSIEYKYSWRPDIRFIEYICEENNRNFTDENGVVRAK